MKNRIVILSISAALLCATAGSAFASVSAPLKQSLKAVRSADLPAHVAKRISEHSAGNRGTFAVDLVKAAVSVNPAAAPAIVAAVARSTPEVAADVAGAAASLQPKLSGAIAKAAVAAAPAHVTEIVAAVCKQAPTQYSMVAIGASQSAPAATSEILTAVSTTIPALKPLIEQAKSDPNNTTVTTVVGQTEIAVATASRTMGITPEKTLTLSGPQIEAVTPRVGAPFTPGGGTPGEIHRSQTVEVTPGSGRNYSR